MSSPIGKRKKRRHTIDNSEIRLTASSRSQLLSTARDQIAPPALSPKVSQWQAKQALQQEIVNIQRIAQEKYRPDQVDLSKLKEARIQNSRSIPSAQAQPKSIFDQIKQRRKDKEQEDSSQIDLRDAWEKADTLMRSYVESKGLKITPEEVYDLIFLLNKTLIGDISKIRDERNGVIGQVKPKDIEAELQTFSEWLSQALEKVFTGDQDPIVLAAQTAVTLNGIHPFIDGNGRTITMLMDFILMSSDLPPYVVSNAMQMPAPLNLAEPIEPQIANAVTNVANSVRQAMVTLGIAEASALDT